MSANMGIRISRFRWTPPALVSIFRWIKSKSCTNICCSFVENNDATSSRFSRHRAVMTCTKLWHDRVIRSQAAENDIWEVYASKQEWGVACHAVKLVLVRGILNRFQVYFIRDRLLLNTSGTFPWLIILGHELQYLWDDVIREYVTFKHLLSNSITFYRNLNKACC